MAVSEPELPPDPCSTRRGTVVALRAVSRPGHGSSLLHTALSQAREQNPGKEARDRVIQIFPEGC